MKFLFWVGVGLWVIPQIEKQFFAHFQGKRFNQ